MLHRQPPKSQPALTLAAHSPYGPRAHARGAFPRPPPLPPMLENVLSRGSRGAASDLGPVARVRLLQYSPVCSCASAIWPYACKYVSRAGASHGWTHKGPVFLHVQGLDKATGGMYRPGRRAAKVRAGEGEAWASAGAYSRAGRWERGCVVLGCLQATMSYGREKEEGGRHHAGYAAALQRLRIHVFGNFQGAPQ